ncbi:unnamed protein product, partial [Brassica oleracea]
PIARTLKEKKNIHDEEKNMSTSEIPSVDFDRAQRDYWCQVRQSEGFDMENVSIPSNMCGMITGLLPFDCVRYSYPYCVLVNLYAKVGLHRYNMLKVIKQLLFSLCFNMKLFVPHFHGDAVADGFFKGELPDWPSDDALNDGKRFYLVRLSESEWQASDWISMYLELVICAYDRRIREVSLHILSILEVAIETGVEDVEPPNERLKAKSVNVYIKFKGMANVITPRMIFESGEHVERKAVVRRVLDEHSGDMTLSGKFCGGQSTRNQPSVALQSGKKIQSCKKRPRLD